MEKLNEGCGLFRDVLSGSRDINIENNNNHS